MLQLHLCSKKSIAPIQRTSNGDMTFEIQTTFVKPKDVRFMFKTNQIELQNIEKILSLNFEKKNGSNITNIKFVNGESRSFETFV